MRVGGAAGRFLEHRLVRFLAVGCINTSFSYLVYAFFLAVGCNFAIANFLALVIGIIFSFKMQGTLVFRNAASGRFGRYIASWLTLYLCNIGLIKLLMNSSMNAYLAGAVALVPITLLSYLLQKHLVFRSGA